MTAIEVDPETETVAVSTTDNIGGQILAATPQNLRAEAVSENGVAREWKETRKQFENYIMEQNAATQTWQKERGIEPTTHRFTPKYADDVYGKIHGGLRWLGNNTADETPVRTALLTLTGWPFDNDGNIAPPVEFLRGLSDGRTAVLRGIRQRLDKHNHVTDWGYCWVIEPHEQRENSVCRRRGYPHCHIGVAVTGLVNRDEIAELVTDEESPYLRNNPFARACDHGTDAVTIQRQTGDNEALRQLANELTNGLIGYEFDLSGRHISDVPLAYRRLAALLWATNVPSWGTGGNFDRWVEKSQQSYEPDDDSDSTAVDPSTFDDDANVEWRETKPAEIEYNLPDSIAN